MTHTPIQGAKIRHVKRSKAQITGLVNALGKGGKNELSDSGDSSAGGTTGGRKVIRNKVGKRYCTSGILLEFENSVDGDDEQFTLPTKEERG